MSKLLRGCLAVALWSASAFAQGTTTTTTTTTTITPAPADGQPAVMPAPAPAPAAAPAPWSPAIALGGGWSLIPEVQYRPRLFIDSGANFTAGTFADRAVISHRARLVLTVKNAEFFTAHVQLQDVRVWGEEADVTNDFSANGFDLHQGYVSIPMGKYLEAKLGRQEIIFDNARLVGNLGWYQRARSFDAARLNIKVPDVMNVTAFWSMAAEPTIISDGSLNVATPRTSEVGFGGIHLNINALKSPGPTISVMYLVHENVPAKETRHTVGGFLSGKAGGLNYQAEGYYQLGQSTFVPTMGEPTAAAISAFMAAAKVGYTLDVTTKPSLNLGIDYLSGSEAAGNTVRRAKVFDTLYATNHAMYGEMDFFLNIPVATAGLGLMHAYAMLAFNPHEKVNVSLAARYFQTAAASAMNGSSLGIEMDLKAVYKVNKFLSVDLMYGVFMPIEGCRALKAIPNGLSPEHQVYMTVDAAI